MVDELAPAKRLVEQVRFSGDTLRYKSHGDAARTDALAGTLFHNELEITAQVTPELSAQLETVCNRLQIPKSSVHAFVYPSPELQGACFATSTSSCVLRFSSALVGLLNAHEFSFVCGHELGHFLFGHGIAKMEERDLSIEYFMQQRAQEISVDRVGLIGCGSLEVSIRALMKTASGLNSDHLRFDVGTFISQLEKASVLGSRPEYMATHPSILVRCRALLWFSLNDYFHQDGKEFSQEKLEALDERIHNDLNRYVDGPARKKIEQAKMDLAMWVAAYEIVQNGVFEKREQAIFADMFGTDMLQRLVNFLHDIPKSEVQDSVFQRMKDSRDFLESLVPSSFEAEVEKIQMEVSANFG